MKLTNTWRDVLYSDPLVHLGILGAIAFGTFQGYLKDRIAGPLPYALADGLFALAVIVWFGTLALRHESLRGPGAVPGLLLALILVPVLYLVDPTTPLLVKLAGLRSWSLFPIASLVALSIVRTRGQVRAYVGFILLLCLITGLYGIYQYIVGPNVVVSAGKLALERHGASVFYTYGQNADFEFRAFSTFTFPAPFAAMMVFGILLAAGVALSRGRGRVARLTALLLIPVFFVGMTVSGTRAALVILFIGLLVLAWYRRLSVWQVLLIPVGLVALHIATLLTAGRILERYRTILLQEGLLWTYLTNPVSTALQYLSEHPFGVGLGRTGIGVPFAITQAYPRGYFVFTDGDVGRAAVELGVVGVVLLGVVAYLVLRYVTWAIKRLRGTDASDLALGVGALLVSEAVVLLIGSPLSTIPHGLIWWFLFGALLKLASLADGEVGEVGEAEEAGKAGEVGEVMRWP